MNWWLFILRPTVFCIFMAPCLEFFEPGEEIIWEDTGYRVSIGREMVPFKIKILTPCDPEDFSFYLKTDAKIMKPDAISTLCMNILRKHFEPALFEACHSPKAKELADVSSPSETMIAVGAGKYSVFIV